MPLAPLSWTKIGVEPLQVCMEESGGQVLEPLHTCMSWTWHWTTLGLLSRGGNVPSLFLKHGPKIGAGCSLGCQGMVWARGDWQRGGMVVAAEELAASPLPPTSPMTSSDCPPSSLKTLWIHSVDGRIENSSTSASTLMNTPSRGHSD